MEDHFSFPKYNSKEKTSSFDDIKVGRKKSSTSISHKLKRNEKENK